MPRLFDRTGRFFGASWEPIRTALHDAELPAGFVDLDAFDANAAALLRRAGDRPIRVATKSVRSVPLLRRVLASDSRYQGLLCAGPREAAALAERGFDDLLVAYPSLERPALDAVGAALALGADITLMVDGAAHLAPLAEVARRHRVTVPVCLEIDVSQEYPGVRFGSYRSPLRTPAEAVAFADLVTCTAGLSVRGVMAYEGQIAGVGDRGAGPRQLVIRRLQARARREVAARRATVVTALRAAGHGLSFINAGGTGSLESSAAEPIVTEVAAGSGLLSPALFDRYRAFRHRPAAGFALRVVRAPAPAVVTCAGGGFVASGAVGADRWPVPVSPPGMRFIGTEGAGEVQTPLRVPSGVRLSVGDVVLFRHAKAGELCDHMDELIALQGGQIVDRFATYRGEGIRIP